MNKINKLTTRNKLALCPGLVPCQQIPSIRMFILPFGSYANHIATALNKDNFDKITKSRMECLSKYSKNDQRYWNSLFNKLKERRSVILFWASHKMLDTELFSEPRWRKKAPSNTVTSFGSAGYFLCRFRGSRNISHFKQVFHRGPRGLLPSFFTATTHSRFLMDYHWEFWKK